MRNLNIVTVHVASEDVKINHNEEAMRLKVARDYKNEAIDECKAELQKVLNYKYSYRLVKVERKKDGICNLGFGDIKSHGLYQALDGCSEAYLLAVTTGIGVDRLLNKLAITSPAKCFITDSLASAAAESFCDYADDALRGISEKPMRFSPGYGDMPLDWQPALLEALNAKDTLGITLNKSLLMTPVKSITAIMGVKND